VTPEPQPLTAEPEAVTAEPQPPAAEPEAVTAEPEPLSAKPTVSELGIDLAAQAWRRSGHGDGAIEVAFVHAGPAGGTVGASGPWVLMRVAGDPDRRVLVFDRHEWECFLDGARNGEFDDAASGAANAASGAAGAASGAANAASGAAGAASGAAGAANFALG
jgi:hypothetical protein